MTDKGVAADPWKIEAVRAFPTPTDLKHLRSFLGLASYYKRLIPNFAKIANPLHALTRKDTPFLWSSDCEQAFENLKQSLTQASVLAFPNFDKHFLLETDASGVGLGAVLAQEQEDGSVRALAYANGAFTTIRECVRYDCTNTICRGITSQGNRQIGVVMHKDI